MDPLIIERSEGVVRVTMNAPEKKNAASGRMFEALRDAFIAVMKDKDFLHDAESLRLDVTPASGEHVQDVVTKLYAAPKEIVQRAKELIVP